MTHRASHDRAHASTSWTRDDPTPRVRHAGSTHIAYRCALGASPVREPTAIPTHASPASATYRTLVAPSQPSIHPIHSVSTCARSWATVEPNASGASSSERRRTSRTRSHSSRRARRTLTPTLSIRTRLPSGHTLLMTEWWREGVLYQIYIRSFADSDGDGIGDIRGVIEHLDHLAWLGIDGIWLSPVHPSPNHDWGYDVADYRDVHPELGDLGTLDRLV